MKTKELIRELQQIDPSGNQEVVIGTEAIHFVQKVPAYYDGCYTTLIRDSELGHIIVAGIKSVGDKIDIKSMHWKDVLCDNPDAKIEADFSSFSDATQRKEMEQEIEDYRDEMRVLHKKVMK